MSLLTSLLVPPAYISPTFTGTVTTSGRIRYGVNKETLSGNKAMTSSDVQVQMLNPNGANRDVTLYASPTAGDAHIVKNTGTGGYILTLKNNAGTTLITIANNVAVGVIYDGSAWQLC